MPLLANLYSKTQFGGDAFDLSNIKLGGRDSWED